MNAQEKEAILQNLREGLRVLRSIPDVNFDLSIFKNECGTNACAIGWIASDARFNALGLVLLKNNEPHLSQAYKPVFKIDGPDRYVDIYSHNSKDFYDRLNAMFGPKAFDALFSERFDPEDEFEDDETIFDRQILEEYGNEITDRELATLRIAAQISVVEQM